MADVHNVVPDLRHLLVRTGDLRFDPRPHRRHPREEIEHLKGSLVRFGMDQPLIVGRETMTVFVGNARLAAAKELGWTHVAALVVDRAEAELIARGIIDNRLADLATSDRDVLAELLSELQGADPSLPTGFDDRELAELLDRLEAKNPLAEEPADEGEPPDATGIALGAAWRLGSHVLLCGDSGSESSVARAFDLAGGTADMILTDPPYGISYGEKTGRKIANDQGEQDYRRFFATFLRLAPLSRKNTVYTFMSGREAHHLRLAFEDAGITFGDHLVWVKQRPTLGRGDYNPGCEHILYGWRGSHKFYGAVGQSSTVLTFDRPVASPLHPSAKPCDLLVRLIRDGSPPNGLVYDAFAGSGSTLISCEMSGRRCTAVELLPDYCATIVRRWERFTGQTAERVS